MAGMRVVVVACDDDGNVDVDDLKPRSSSTPTRSPALMVTYPSTHGVFEAAIREICDLVHATAARCTSTAPTSTPWSAWPSPGEFGADVSHLNLHKTFCIPHGGGGPGRRPGRGAQHLAPFLPNHPSTTSRRPRHRPRTRLGRPVRLGRDPADLVGVRALMGPARADRGHRGRDPQRQLRSRPGSASTTRCSTPASNGRVAHECIVDLRASPGARGSPSRTSPSA
jgi:glycine dehydrogenase